MELLDPTEIYKQKSKDNFQMAERIGLLAKEESRLVKSISDLKIIEDKKKNYIKLINKEYLKTVEKINYGKDILNQEVLELENRKKETKKPVDQKLDEINNGFNKIEEKKKEIKISQGNINIAREKISEDNQIIEKGKKENEDKVNKINIREKNVVKLEKENKQSELILDNKIKKFGKYVNNKNKEFKIKEEGTRIVEIANENVRIANAAESKRLYDKDIMIIDKYNTLLKATEEFNNKKNDRSNKR